MILSPLSGIEETKCRLWDDFVLSSPFAHPFQTWDWGEIVKELGWEPIRYQVENKERILLVAQILKRKRGPFSILYIPRGPIFFGRDGFDFFVNNLKKICRANNAIFCKINPAIEKPSEIERWYSENRFFKSKNRDMHICTYQIDLTRSLDEIWWGFRGNVRTAIRKAEKSDVYVMAEDGEEGLKRFYKVYSSLERAGKVRVHNYKFFYNLWKTWHTKGYLKIFNGLHNNEPVATEFVLLFCKKAEQMWTASIKLDKDTGASQLIHWRIINWLKERRFELYDLGGVPPEKNMLPGIQFYKKSLGGDFVHYLGEYELSGNPLFYWAWRLIGKIYISRKRS